MGAKQGKTKSYNRSSQQETCSSGTRQSQSNSPSKQRRLLADSIGMRVQLSPPASGGGGQFAHQSPCDVISLTKEGQQHALSLSKKSSSQSRPPEELKNFNQRVRRVSEKAKKDKVVMERAAQLNIPRLKHLSPSHGQDSEHNQSNASLNFGTAMQAVQRYQVNQEHDDDEEMPANIPLNNKSKSSRPLEESKNKKIIRKTTHNKKDKAANGEDVSSTGVDSIFFRDSPPIQAALADFYCDSEGSHNGLRRGSQGGGAADGVKRSHQSADKVNESKVLHDLRKAARKNPRRFQQLMNQVLNQSDTTEEELVDQPNLSSSTHGLDLQMAIADKSEELKTEKKTNHLSPVAQVRIPTQKMVKVTGGTSVSKNVISCRTDVARLSGDINAQGVQNSLRFSQSSAVSKRFCDKQSQESSVHVQLKSQLSQKQSGNTLRQSELDSKQGTESNHQQLSQINTLQKNEQTSILNQSNKDTVALSASPTVKRSHVCKHPMNTSTKKLAQMPRHSRINQMPMNNLANTHLIQQLKALKKQERIRNFPSSQSQRMSNNSDETPGFQFSLDKKIFLLANQNMPPESPGQNILEPCSSSSGVVRVSKGCDNCNNQDSQNLSSHFKIAPGGSGSFTSGKEHLQSTSPKLSSQQTFGAKHFMIDRAASLIGNSQNKSQSNPSQKHNQDNFSQGDFSKLSKDQLTGKLLVIGQQSSQDYKAPQTSPQRQSIDDTMRNITRINKNNKVFSPEVVSFQARQSVKIEIKKENGVNEMIQSELSSSLITSYNSDDKGDQLRVREDRKARRQESSTKRSMTSPSSFKTKQKHRMKPTKVRQALEKVNSQTQKKSAQFKRMHSSQGGRVLNVPTFEGASGSKGSQKNSHYQLTECGSKGSSCGVKRTLSRPHTSKAMSPALIRSDKASDRGNILNSSKSQSKSRSNSRSSNVKNKLDEKDSGNSDPKRILTDLRLNTSQQMCLSHPPSPLTASTQIYLNPKGQNPEFETIKDKSQTNSICSQMANQVDRTQHEEQSNSLAGGDSSQNAVAGLNNSMQSHRGEVNVEAKQTALQMRPTAIFSHASNELPHDEGRISPQNILPLTRQNSAIDEQGAFEEATRSFKYFSAQKQSSENVITTVDNASNFISSSDQLRQNSSGTEISKNSVSQNVAGPRKSILASVPENEEENKNDGQTSRQSSHQSSYDFLKQTSGEIVHISRRSKTSLREPMRPQKSMVMQPSALSFLIENKVPLRQQQTTTIFNDQASSSTTQNEQIKQEMGAAHFFKASNAANASGQKVQRSSLMSQHQHFSQQVFFNAQQQKRRKQRQYKKKYARNHATQDVQKLRLMQSPQGNFVLPNRQRTETMTDMMSQQIRSQSSSRKSQNRLTVKEDQNQKQIRQKQINEAIVQIDSIYTNLMTPAASKKQCGCGNGSKCSAHCNSTTQLDYTPKSDKNFTSYFENRMNRTSQIKLDKSIEELPRRKSSHSIPQYVARSQQQQDDLLDIRSQQVVIQEESPDAANNQEDPQSNHLHVSKMINTPASDKDYEKSSSSHLSEEILDYTQPGLRMYSTQHNVIDQQPVHLSQEKTCKTIRELTIEDAVSSMGNLSANISPQITSVKNLSVKSRQQAGAGGSILGSRKVNRRRRKSEKPTISALGDYCNPGQMIKSSNTHVQFLRQQSIQYSKTGAENALSQAGNSDYNTQLQVEQTNNFGTDSKQKKRTLFAQQRGLIHSRVTSQLTCTECGMSEENSPRGSQILEEVELTTEDVTKGQKDTHKPPSLFHLRQSSQNQETSSHLKPSDCSMHHPKRRRSKTIRDMDVQPHNKTQFLDSKNNDLAKPSESIIQKQTTDLNFKKSCVKSGTSTPKAGSLSSNFAQTAKSVQFEPMTPQNNSNISRGDDKIIIEECQRPKEGKIEPPQIFEWKNIDYSNMAHLRITEQKSETEVSHLKVTDNKLKQKMVKADSVNEVGSSKNEIFQKIAKVDSFKGSQQNQSVAETAHFLKIDLPSNKDTPKSSALLGSIRQDSNYSPKRGGGSDARLVVQSDGLMSKSSSEQTKVPARMVKYKSLQQQALQSNMIKVNTDQQTKMKAVEESFSSESNDFERTPPSKTEVQKQHQSIIKVVEIHQKKKSNSRPRGLLHQFKKQSKTNQATQAKVVKTPAKSPIVPKSPIVIKNTDITFETKDQQRLVQTPVIIKKKSILKNAVDKSPIRGALTNQLSLPQVNEETDGGFSTSPKKTQQQTISPEKPTYQQQQHLISSRHNTQPQVVPPQPYHSESPVKSKLPLATNSPQEVGTKKIVTRRKVGGMRLIKMVGKVYRSTTPQQQDGPKFLEFFDLSRTKKIIDHLQESKLVGDQIAKQLGIENNKRYEEAIKKAEIESKNKLTTRLHKSPDYHQAIDNSTPSVNRSSVKLPFGTSHGFQDYYHNTNLDNYEMTPSNFNQMERASHSSEVYTYGGSSAALYFSEVFNPDLYDEEKLIDSYDQSPMGISQSQMSELQWKLSSKGGASKEVTQRQQHQISHSISDLDLQKVQDMTKNDQKMKFNSIVQQSGGNTVNVNREQANMTPITDCRQNNKNKHNTLMDDKNNSQLGLHLLRPNQNFLRDAEIVSTFSRSDLNFPLPSQRHSTSDESSRITSQLYDKNLNSRKSSVSKVDYQYQTAEPQQSTKEDMKSHRQEQLLKTAEKSEKKTTDKIRSVQVQEDTTGTQESQKVYEVTPANRKPETTQKKQQQKQMYHGSFAQAVKAQMPQEKQYPSALQVPGRRPTMNQAKTKEREKALQNEQFKLRPELQDQLASPQRKVFDRIVDQNFNVLHLPERTYKRQTTIRSCATGRNGKVTDLSSRNKTDGNISQFEKESISDMLLTENQLASYQKIASSESVSQMDSNRINTLQRFQQQANQTQQVSRASHFGTSAGQRYQNRSNSALTKSIMQSQSDSYNENEQLTVATAKRDKYYLQTSTPTNLNSKRRIKPERVSRQQTSEVKSNISRIRHTSITTTSCVSTKVCGKERINQYQIMQKVGTGSFAEVFVCFDVNDNKVYAMKVMNKTKLRRKTISMASNAFDSVKSEMVIMKKLDHPYICKLYEIIDDPNQHKLYLIIEYSKQGTIEKKIEKLYKQDRRKKGKTAAFTEEATNAKKQASLPEDIMRKYFSQLILALEYCHNQLGIIHRDIKPENLLIDANDDIKLADFGVSQLLPQDGNDKVRSNAGSAYFYSPEACIGTMYKGRLNDVWACGITLFYMATGKYPFVSTEHQKLYRLIQTTEPEYPAEMVNTPLHDLICRLLKKQPEDRITIALIKDHPWITKDGTEPLQDVNVDEVTAPTETELKHAYTTSVKREKFIYHRKVQDAASAFN